MHTIIIPEIHNLQWSEPKLVTTSRGPCLVKSAKPNDQFWNLWRDHKPALKSSGFSVGKWEGQFTVSWWAQDDKFNLPSLESIAEEVIEPPVLKPLQFPTGFKSWQPPLVQYIVAAMKTHGTSLNGCGTGIGKTFITLGAARELDLKLIVVCPKNIVGDWLEAFKLMKVECAGIYGWEWMKTGKTDYLKWRYSQVKRKQKDGSYILVNQKDTLEWDVPPDTAVVFDECHRAANDGTQNQQMVISAVESGITCFALSATIADNPIKMRAIGLMLKLHKNGHDYFDWLKAHGVTQGRFGLQFQGSARHLQAIHKTIFPHKGVRVRAEQLGDAFPKTQILAKAYAMDESEEISSVYDEMMQRCAELEAAQMDASSRMANILVEILRARQRVELLKVPLIVGLTKDSVEEGNSVFIAVNFRDTVKELIKQLDIKSVVIGGMKPEIRKQSVEAFQQDQNHILVGIIKACREGMNLQDFRGERARLALISPTPSSFDLRQVLGRVWRPGGGLPSMQCIMFAKGTVEEDLCKSLATKLDSLDILMDGDLQNGVFPASYSTMRPQTETEDEPS